MYDSSITSQIPSLIHCLVMIFIFDCVTLQTSHSVNLVQTLLVFSNHQGTSTSLNVLIKNQLTLTRPLRPLVSGALGHGFLFKTGIKFNDINAFEVGILKFEIRYFFQIPNHTEDDCPLTIIPCPYVKTGCETKVCKCKLRHFWVFPWGPRCVLSDCIAGSITLQSGSSRERLAFYKELVWSILFQPSCNKYKAFFLNMVKLLSKFIFSCSFSGSKWTLIFNPPQAFILN